MVSPLEVVCRFACHAAASPGIGTETESSSAGGVQGLHEVEHCGDKHSAGSGTFPAGW